MRIKTNCNSTLLIIDPAVETAEKEGIVAITHHWPGRHHVLRPAMSQEDSKRLKAGILSADAIVLLGSKASVHLDQSWIHDLRAALDGVLDGSTPRPLLAICFGHQLIAHMDGGEIGYLNTDQSKRIGVETSTIRCSQLLPDSELQVVVSHQEVVHRPPDRYRVIARRPDVDFDGLEHESLPIITFQFHPEARKLFAERQGINAEAISADVVNDGDALFKAFLQQRDIGV